MTEYNVMELNHYQFISLITVLLYLTTVSILSYSFALLFLFFSSLSHNFHVSTSVVRGCGGSLAEHTTINTTACHVRYSASRVTNIQLRFVLRLQNFQVCSKDRLTLMTSGCPIFSTLRAHYLRVLFNFSKKKNYFRNK